MINYIYTWEGYFFLLPLYLKNVYDFVIEDFDLNF